jgi:hypothetical protein
VDRVQALLEQTEAVLGGAGVLTSPLAVLLGLAGLVLVASVALIGLLRASARFVGAARRASAAAAIRLAKETKLVVLIADSGGRAPRFARAALDEHFAAFTFDAPVDIRFFPLRLPVPDGRDRQAHRRVVSAAQFWMRQCDADLVIWGKWSAKGGRRRFFAAAPTPDGELPSPVEIDINRRTSPELGRLALGFLAAGVLRPTLSRPYDFKADRLAPLAQRVAQAASEAFTLFGPKTARRIADDYANAAASLGDRLAERSWLDQSLTIATQALEAMDRRTEPVPWARVRQTVARAHGALGEQTRDQKLLTQSRDGFRDALDALAGTDSLILAQGAARGLQRADAALETLRNPPRPQLVQPGQQRRPASGGPNPAGHGQAGQGQPAPANGQSGLAQPQPAPANQLAPGQMRSFYGNYAASLI